MGAIFPLSTGGRIVLIIVMIFIGLIWSMFQWPDWWRNHYKKAKPETKPVVKTELPKGK